MFTTKLARRGFAAWLLLLALLAAGCRQAEDEVVATAVPVTATPAAAVDTTIPPERTADRSFIVVATDAPNAPFINFDQFGEITGFAADFMAAVADAAGLTYEFVVTPYQGVLANIASDTNRDFDAVMPPQPVQDTAVAGIAYTQPYLEIGQVLVVLADDDTIQSAAALQPGLPVGVTRSSDSEVVARETLNIGENALFLFDQTSQALQALAQENVRAVIVNNFMAAYITEQYAQQFKIVGGNGRDAWLSSAAYTIAVADSDTTLLQKLNEAIATVNSDDSLTQLAASWFVDTTPIDAGESRVGTLPNEIVIGVAMPLVDLDPAGDPGNPPNLLSWEVKMNTMGGLYAFDEANELQPLLAADFPTVSEDGLTYTIPLRQDLAFPDGSAFTAEDVKWAINRAGRLGSFLVNSTLQDSNVDAFADADAVTVVDAYTVRIVLQEPLGAFVSLLATPPYFPVSQECFAAALDLLSRCGGIGPYQIVSWEPGVRLRLTANPEWPGTAPVFENVQLRFYDDPASMQNSLAEFQSIDMAWYGLPFNDWVALQTLDLDGDGRTNFASWSGPAVFKSYLIFDHDVEPWDSARVRQAAGLAIDRRALADGVFAGSRQPLFGPVPDGVPGQVRVLPERNIAQARTLLGQEGYSESNPAEMTLYYINDGRYSDREAQYAEAIKAQMEETGIFQVTLQGAAWEVYRIQIASCNYPAYLMGWPSPDRPVNYLDVLPWTEFFIENTDTNFCSNYDNPQMATLLEAALGATETAVRLDAYADIQELWAVDIPTLDLLQESRQAVSLDYLDGVTFDGLGLMRYGTLTKGQ